MNRHASRITTREAEVREILKWLDDEDAYLVHCTPPKHLPTMPARAAALIRKLRSAASEQPKEKS